MLNHKVLLFTSSDIRHKFIASQVASSEYELLVVHEQSASQISDVHLEARAKVEQSFFADAINVEYRAQYVATGTINSNEIIRLIQDFDPDTFVSYGCGLISQATLSYLDCRKINIHLGLSPYYRGTATNFWPIYNNEIQYCGVTFHELTSKIDAGSIFHQFSVDRQKYDTIHHLGNTIIKKIPEELLKVLESQSAPINQTNDFFPKSPRHYYKKSDYSLEKAELAHLKFGEYIEKFINDPSEVKLKTLL